MAKNKSNKSWLHDHINDPYVKLAQREGYRARAAYKLKEIDESENLIRLGHLVIDLGAAPGSWSQYARRKLSGRPGGGINGVIISLDLLTMDPIADVCFIKGDFENSKVLSELVDLLKGKKADLIMSDMAPNLSGIQVVDSARMEWLIELAMKFAKVHLKHSGTLLVKCLKGTSYTEIIEKFKKQFKKVKVKKPKASRDYSSEVYLLGKMLKDLDKS